MTYHFIFQNQLAGTTTDPENLPQGFRVLGGPDRSQDALFYDPATDTVRVKPEQPSPLHYWDTDRWVELPVFIPDPVPVADPDMFESVRRKLWTSILAIPDPGTQFAIALLAQMTLAGYAEQKGRQDLLDEAMTHIKDLLASTET